MEENEVKALLERWTARTVELMLEEIDELKVKDTQALKESLAYSVRIEGDSMIRSLIYFQTHGRFVDMGVGRGRKLEAIRAIRRRRKGRKPRRWYSPTFYGRINYLMGAIGIELMESAMDTLKKGLDED